MLKRVRDLVDEINHQVIAWLVQAYHFRWGLLQKAG